MNLSPEQFQRAQEMMRSMNPETMSQMMNIMNQNPDLVRQAMQMSRNMPGQFQPPPSTSHESQFLSKMEQTKAKGNEHFKKGDFESSGMIYLDALVQIEGFRKQHSQIHLERDLQILENKIRLNYSRSKLNLGDFKIGIESAKRVHLNDQSGKSAYYWASGLFQNGDFEEALECALKSKEIQPGEAVDSLINDIQEAIKEKAGETNAKEDAQANATTNTEIERNQEPEEGLTKGESQSKIKQKNDEKKQTESANENHNAPKNNDDDFKMEQESTMHSKASTNAPRNLTNKTRTTLKKSKTNDKSVTQKINSFVVRNLKFFLGMLVGLLISYLLGSVKSSREDPDL